MSDANSDMQKSSRSESQGLMAHGFSVLGKWTKSSLALVCFSWACSLSVDHVSSCPLRVSAQLVALFRVPGASVQLSDASHNCGNPSYESIRHRRTSPCKVRCASRASWLRRLTADRTPGQSPTRT